MNTCTTRSPAGEKPSSYACWLDYGRAAGQDSLQAYRPFFSRLLIAGGLTVPASASELAEAGSRLFGEKPRIASEEPEAPHLALSVDSSMNTPEGYRVTVRAAGGKSAAQISISGTDHAGVLYGVFAFLRAVVTGTTLQELSTHPLHGAPSNKLRTVQHWDNFDGTIERGYAGTSLFFQKNRFVTDMTRIRDYGRLLASVGINALCINNVNVFEQETLFITQEYLPCVARIADTLRPYGIRLFLSVNFAAPMQVDGLLTADPLDDAVQAWWRDAAERVYLSIPDFGGFVVKADSEGRPGPFSYGRNHAEGANMLARALAPHGGTVIWRCFVYNCRTDWRDRTTDRARAAYDHFKLLDGQFDENVMLQIKNGPMDFQVREAVSPLFGALEHTHMVAEFQITQEYTGQQKHICYLVPTWEETLRFDTFAQGEDSPVADCVSGKLFGHTGGIAAVSNVGNSDCWTGHPLAQANLYGFGRLSWDTSLTAEKIAEEWIALTFGSDKQVKETLLPLLCGSRAVYEKYTAPLGVGWMVAPNHHYGPDVDGYEYSRWGTYHFADRNGIGVDRTQKSGTGYTAQYHAPVSDRYEALETCPDDLLLFFHHVPYEYVLHSGKTVLQHIYDTHFEGAEAAREYGALWAALEGKIPRDIFDEVRNRLQVQRESAIEWRDIINTYFFRRTGIPDAHGRTIYP